MRQAAPERAAEPAQARIERRKAEMLGKSAPLQQRRSLIQARDNSPLVPSPERIYTLAPAVAAKIGTAISKLSPHLIETMLEEPFAPIVPTRACKSSLP